MYGPPRLTDREFRLIESVLPPSSRRGRPPADHRQCVAELLLTQALPSRWYPLQEMYGRKRGRFLAQRRRRWEQDGTWARILEISAPIEARLRREFTTAVATAPT
jgi:hypothetical protein